MCLQYECCGVEKYTDMPNAPTLPVACCPVIKNTVACTEEKAYPTVSIYTIFYLHYTFRPILGGHLWDKEKVTL